MRYIYRECVYYTTATSDCFTDMQNNYSALMEAAASNHDEVLRVLTHTDTEDFEIPSLVSNNYINTSSVCH